MTDEEILEKVIDAAEEIDGRKKLACKKAFSLSAEYGIPLLDIAKYCNKGDIKICSCQLGCFK